MTPLTPKQKEAGRAWRAYCQIVLDERNVLHPPGRYVLSLHRVVRHECPVQGGRSTGITLREHREESPEYWVCYCGVVAPLIPGSFPHRDCDGGRVIAAEGLFAWIWKEAKCSGCGLALRSRRGRLLVSDRAGEPGRAASAGQASAHHRDT